MTKLRKFLRSLPLILLVGCAATSRDCASCRARNYGADWIVLQYGASGEPINCWKLVDVGVDNEEHTDGIYWREPDGHLVHISGWYNRVQVADKKFDEAAARIGVDARRCQNGRYVTATDAGAR